MSELTPQQLVAQYAEYLKNSIEKFGDKTADQVIADRKKNFVGMDDPYAHPDVEFNNLISRGGFVPIMIYNATLNGQLPPDQLQTKLDAWSDMQKKFQTMFEKLDSHPTPEYAAWKQRQEMSSAAVSSLSEREKEGLYTLEVFRTRYFEYEADATVIGEIGRLSEHTKLKGDCDSMSYVFGGLLMGLKNPIGAPVFESGVGFEHIPSVPGHTRLLIGSSSGKGVLFESTVEANHTAGIDSARAKDLQQKMDNGLEPKFVFPSQAIVKQSVADGQHYAIDAGDMTDALIRALCLADNTDGTPRKLIQGQRLEDAYKLFDDEKFYDHPEKIGTDPTYRYKQIPLSDQAPVNATVQRAFAFFDEAQKAGQPIPEKQYETTYWQCKAIEKTLNQALTSNPGKEKEDALFFSDLIHIDITLEILKSYNPEKFEKLEKAHEQLNNLEHIKTSNTFISLTPKSTGQELGRA